MEGDKNNEFFYFFYGFKIKLEGWEKIYNLHLILFFTPLSDDSFINYYCFIARIYCFLFV